MRNVPNGRRVPFIIAALSLLAALGTTPRLVWAFGACCLGDNACGDIAHATCPSSGYWWGEGTTCDGIGAFGQPGGPCDLGACCQRGTPSQPNGSCDYTTRVECEGALCGKWMLGTSTCSNFPGATCDSVFASDPLPCDCDNNGQVTVNELVNTVLLAFGCAPGAPCCVDPYYLGDGSYVCGGIAYPGSCPAADQDHNGFVTINELVKGVKALLEGC